MNFNYSHLYHQDSSKAWSDIVKIHDLLHKAANQGLADQDTKINAIIKQLRKNVFDPSHEAAFVADLIANSHEHVWQSIDENIYKLSEAADLNQQARIKKIRRQIHSRIMQIGLRAIEQIIVNDDPRKPQVIEDLQGATTSFALAVALLKLAKQNALDHSFQILLDQIQRPIKDGYSTFDASILGDRLDTLKEFIHFGCPLDQINPNGETPVTLAIKRALPDLLKLLIDSGANLNLRNAAGFTPLTLAIVLRRTEAVTLLLAAGADPSEKDGLGGSPLNAAFVKNDLNLVKVLIVAKADVNALLLSGDYPLHHVMYTGDFDLIKQLHQAGANLDQYSQEGNTPLLLSLYIKQPKAMSALLEAGADPNKRNAKSNGNTPLIQACSLGNIEVVKQLIGTGADVNYPSAEGDYPIYFAIRSGNYQLVQLLVREGAHIEVRDETGRSPLQWALFYKNEELISILKKAGADSLYVDNVKRGSFLANVWGINGKAQVTGRNRLKQRMDFGGIWGTKDVPPFFFSYLEQFFAFVGDSEAFLTSGVKSWILSVFSNAYPSKSIEEIMSAREAKQPCLILGGCLGHVITMSVTGERLTVSNRGLGRDLQSHATEVFVLPPLKQTKEFFEKLTTKYSTVEEFYVMLRGLRLKSLGGFDHPDQESNNCAIASTEPVLLFLFSVAAKRNLKEGRRLYDKFSFFFREEILKDYKANGSQSPILLQRIHEKQNLKAAQKAKAIRKKLKKRFQSYP
jgi:uncharacterized protein